MPIQRQNTRRGPSFAVLFVLDVHNKRDIVMSKVFLSYSHKDEGFVEKLYRKLVKDGVECWFDREAIPWGSNFVVELEKGIDDCEIIVLVFSPDYCDSEWALIEQTSARIDDPAGLKRRIRPLLLKPCWYLYGIRPIIGLTPRSAILMEWFFILESAQIGETLSIS